MGTHLSETDDADLTDKKQVGGILLDLFIFGSGFGITWLDLKI